MTPGKRWSSYCHNLGLVEGERLVRQPQMQAEPCFRVIELVADDGSVVLVSRNLPPPKSLFHSGWVAYCEALVTRPQLPYPELIALSSFEALPLDQGHWGWPRDLWSKT